MGATEKVVRVEGAQRDGKTPLTCVVALHGAGGSENLFCEGHGALAPKLAAQKGWLLISPLNGPTDDLLEKLSAWHPIDKSRVVTVGHSMGAANATAWAARKPEQLRAVAALGGGGRAGKGEVWQKLPYFVGVGDKDFALKSAKSLAEALGQAGNPSVTLKIYPGLEHLTVVQACLVDVFAFFDQALKK
jgi:dienelactone hydrolase